MSLSFRFSAVALALCLSTQNAFANNVQADASLADAAIPIEEDAQVVHEDAASADASASSDEADAAATGTTTDGAATVVQIPGATGEQFSAPDFEGDDGCASTRASTGSFSTIAVGLFGMLALAWSRRRR